MKCAYADMHCDTVLRGYRDGEESLYNGEGNINFLKMKEAGQLLQFFAVFFPPARAMERFGRKNADGTVDVPDDDTFFADAVETLRRAVAAHSDLIALADGTEDVQRNEAEGKSSAILTIEDGRFINGDITKFERLRKIGVRAIALTWNKENCLGYPNSRDPKIMEKGLTDFGKEAVPVMAALGILPDVSHLNDGGFYDVARLSKGPFIASHSNCRAITDHPRNLTDDEIRTLAEHGGVMGLNFFQEFTVPGKSGENEDPAKEQDTRIDFLAAHMLHMYKVGGEDLPALGTDFDGFDGNPEIDGPDKMYLLFDALKKKGIEERILDKFRSKNVLRVLS